MVPCTTASCVACLLCLVLSVAGSSEEVGGLADSESCAAEASSLELLQKEISLEQRETKAALKRSAQKQISPAELGSKAALKKDALRDRLLLAQRIEKPLLGIGHHMIPEDNKDGQQINLFVAESLRLIRVLAAPAENDTAKKGKIQSGPLLGSSTSLRRGSSSWLSVAIAMTTTAG